MRLLLLLLLLRLLINMAFVERTQLYRTVRTGHNVLSLYGASFRWNRILITHLNFSTYENFLEKSIYSLENLNFENF